jgi:hypothetical protein
VNAAVAQPSSLIVPSGREPWAISLVVDPGYERPLPGGVVLDSIQLRASEVVYAVRQEGLPARDPPLCRVTLRPKAEARPGDLIGRNEFAAGIEVLQPHAAAQAACRAAQASILQRDKGGFFSELAVQGPTAGAVGMALWLAFGAAGVWVLALAAWLTWRRAWSQVTLRFKLTQLVPALLQAAIFAYWASAVPSVRDHMPHIAAQLGFAYALDFLAGLTLQRRWDLTFGPVPIVLSTNIFVWFPTDQQHLAFSAIAVAVLAKWLLCKAADGRWVWHPRADARHVFNPSALGVTAVGVVCLLVPQWGQFEDIAHLIAKPPYMMPLLIALTLVPQLLVPIASVTLPATLVLLAFKFAGAYQVYPFWPAVFLALTLLVTDPATIPCTGVGRVLYGIGYGLGVWVASAGLSALGESDFFGKAIAVPLVNLLVTRFDTWGARMAVLEPWLGPRWNRVHVCAWLALAVGFQYF